MHGKNTDVSVLKCQVLLSPHGRIMGDLFIYFSYFSIRFFLKSGFCPEKHGEWEKKIKMEAVLLFVL